MKIGRYEVMNKKEVEEFIEKIVRKEINDIYKRLTKLIIRINDLERIWMRE